MSGTSTNFTSEQGKGTPTTPEVLSSTIVCSFVLISHFFTLFIIQYDYQASTTIVFGLSVTFKHLS
jgi:hypothetical protein